jgi:hypothetical protein
MRFDLSLEAVCQKLNARSRAFAISLRTVKSAESYSFLIAALIESIIADDPEGRLWLSYLGFNSCLSILPSDMLPLPIQTYFYRRRTKSLDFVPRTTAPLSLRLHPAFRRGEWSLSDGIYSFFGIDVPTAPLIEIHFGGRLAPKLSTRSRTKRPHVFFVTDEMIDFLDEAGDNIPFSQNELYNTNDLRLKNFLRRHGRALTSLLSHDNPLDEAKPNSQISPEYEALSEILMLRRLSPMTANHAYIVPCPEDRSGRGAFCYFFFRPLDDFERAFLRFTSDRLFYFLREHDRTDAARRIAETKTLLPFAPADFHSLGNAMGTTLNHLLYFQNDPAFRSIPNGVSRLEEAISAHQEAFQQITRAREQATPFFSWGPRRHLQQLLLMWITRWKPCSLYRFELPCDQLYRRFSLPGPEDELADVLYQFLEIRHRFISDDNAINRLYEYRPNDIVLNMSIDDYASRLRILIFTGHDIPHHNRWWFPVYDPLRNITLFDRLPSAKPDGGKGILSSILSIRDRFHGQCVYQSHEQSPGSHWRINIPIQCAQRKNAARVPMKGV